MKAKWMMALGVIGCLSAFLMYQHQLWTWYPMPFFAAFWLLIFSYRTKRHASAHQTKYIVLSTLSGIWLAAGFPGITPFAPILFVAWIPLLYVAKALQAEGAKMRTFWFYCYHTLVIWNIVTTFWVANSVLLPSFIAIFLNSLLMSLPWLAFWKISNSNRFPQWFSYASILPFWLIFEVVHLSWEISWPWLTLGNAFSSTFPLVQWYQYTGVHGGTIWIFLVNFLLFSLVSKYEFSFKSVSGNWRSNQPKLMAIAALLVLPMILSLVQYYTPAAASPKEIEVVVVQPNFEPHYEKFEVDDATQFNRFLALTSGIADQNTNYIVYPETSFEQVSENEPSETNTIFGLQRMLSRYPNATLISGVGSYKFLGASEPTRRSTRKLKQDPGRRWEAYNAAMQIQNDSTRPFSFYHKSRFVPGAELMPYPFIFGFLQPFFDKFGGSMEGYGAQDDRTTLQSNNGTAIASSICFESIYGNFMRGFMQNGAKAIFIVTNDGWWGNTPGYKQHHEFARLRAIESNRWIARSANTGISSFIDTKGNSYQETKYGEAIAIKQNIPLYDDLTFYVKYGDWIVWCFILAYLILGTYFAIQGPRAAK